MFQEAPARPLDSCLTESYKENVQIPAGAMVTRTDQALRPKQFYPSIAANRVQRSTRADNTQASVRSFDHACWVANSHALRCALTVRREPAKLALGGIDEVDRAISPGAAS